MPEEEDKYLEIWQFAKDEKDSTLDLAEAVGQHFDSELDTGIELYSTLLSAYTREKRKRNMSRREIN